MREKPIKAPLSQAASWRSILHSASHRRGPEALLRTACVCSMVVVACHAARFLAPAGAVPDVWRLESDLTLEGRRSSPDLQLQECWKLPLPCNENAGRCQQAVLALLEVMNEGQVWSSLRPCRYKPDSRRRSKESQCLLIWKMESHMMMKAGSLQLLASRGRLLLHCQLCNYRFSATTTKKVPGALKHPAELEPCSNTRRMWHFITGQNSAARDRAPHVWTWPLFKICCLPGAWKLGSDCQGLSVP